MAEKYSTFQLNEAAAMDLRRWRGELMAESDDGRMSLSAAVLEALRLARLAREAFALGPGE